MSDSPQSAAGAASSVNNAEYEWLYGGLAETDSDAPHEPTPDTASTPNPDVTRAAAGPTSSTGPNTSTGTDAAHAEDNDTDAPAARSAAETQQARVDLATDETSTPEDAAPAAPADTQTKAAAEVSRAPIAAVIVARTLLARLKVPALLAMIFAAWMALGSPIPGASPDSNPEAATARNAMADPVVAQALNDQKAAESYLAKHGNLNGFTLRGKDVRFAAAGSTFLASRLVDGVCYAYAWEGAGQNKPVQDATGAACTDEQITQAQIVLDEQSVALAEAADNQASAAFTAASATASQFAINSWVDGAPSLQGLGNDLGSGVRVVQNAGTWLVAQYGEGTACRQATISADATVGEITPCP